MSKRLNIKQKRGYNAPYQPLDKPMTQAIVIDTSSILAICKEDEDSLHEESAIAGFALIAPESVQWELVNALCQAVYKKRISKAIAEKTYKTYQSMAKNISFIDIDKSKAMEIAISKGVMSYDAYVLQCALENNLPLLTSEKDAVNKMPYHARALGIQLVRFSS